MIAINIRGACGAGKSSLVKRIMGEVKDWRDLKVPGRLKPVGNISFVTQLFVSGHYQIQNGGMDTIGDVREAYGYLHRWGDTYNLLFEGMNQKRDYGELASLKKVTDLRILFLMPPLETCRAGFAAKGQSRQEDYVGRTYRKAQAEINMLGTSGHATMVFEDREKAFQYVRETLL